MAGRAGGGSVRVGDPVMAGRAGGGGFATNRRCRCIVTGARFRVWCWSRYANRQTVSFQITQVGIPKL